MTAVPGPIKIGFISDLSGVYGGPAHSQLEGVTLAVEELNASGGAFGTPLEIVVRDTEVDAEKTRARTRELIEHAGVHIIIGGLSSGMHTAINAVTKELGVTFVSIGQTNELTLAENLGPHTFHQAFSPYMTAQGMGKWALKNLGRKWFLTAPAYSWGDQIVASYEELARRENAEIVGVARIPFPAGDGDHAAHFDEIRRGMPDVLLANNFGGDQIKFITEAGNAGLRRDMSIAITLSEGSTIGSIDPDLCVGMYWGATFYHALRERFETAQRFVTAFVVRFGKVPSAYAAYGYSAMHEAGYGLRAGFSPQVDACTITRALEGRHFAHYKSNEWWRPCDHQAFQDYFIMRVKGAEERKGPDDTSSIVGSTPWDLDFERTCEVLGHTHATYGHADEACPGVKHTS